MKCRAIVLAVGLGLLGLAGPARSQAKEDPAHEELRTLFKEMVSAYNKGDYDKLMTHLDDQVVIIWQNATVNRGPAAVRAYFDEMLKGPNKRVQSSTIEPEVEELTHLYGDTGVAFGKSKDHYKLTDGMEFTQDTRWTATVVKKNGQWKLASLQVGTNVFDNPVLDLAIHQTAKYAGGIGAFCGLFLGLLLMFIFGRRRSA